VPGAQVDGFVGRQTSFEVTVNEQLVHSKLQTMSFPEFKDVVSVVKEVSDGAEPRKVEKLQPASCTIV